jgi:hypothetical protein
MKRIIVLMALLGFVFSAVLTGCGGNDTTPPTPAATNAPPASTNK